MMGDKARIHSPRRVAAGFVAFAALAAGPASAVIVECTPDPAAYTVFLSEPEYTPEAFASRDKLREFLERLQFYLDQQRDGRWIRSPGTDVRFKLCLDRQPSPADDGEFAPGMVDTMYKRRVLIEIWGRLYVESDSGGTTRSAQLNYLLVPIKQAHNRKESVPNALQRLQYPEQKGRHASDFVQLIAKPRDIDAFVATALGFKLLREGNRELAHKNLCKANVLLQAIAARRLGAGTQQDIDALRAFVLDSAARALAAGAGARATDLQDTAQPCGAED